MSKTLLAALAAAAIFSGATLVTRAAAMTLAAPSAFGAASAPSALVERVAVVCGMNGCARVQVVRVRRPPPGFVRRGAPLVFPASSGPLVAPENK
jgi:hypothetical protein